VKPDVSQLLQMTGMQVPGLAAHTSYAQGSATMITGLLMMAAVEVDRGVENRVTDNAEMRALFASLAPGVKDVALKAEVEAAAKTKDTSLRISALNQDNAGLRKVLIKLQTHVEDAGDREAQKKIWAVLKASAERRILSMGG
jgi:hypothetical protein